MGLFGRLLGRRAENTYLPLRNAVLEIDATALGVDASTPVLAVLFEFGRSGGAATLVALADGTVSIYTSTGGGILGAGEHPGSAAAARRLLQIATDVRTLLSPADVAPPPSTGRESLVIVAHDGLRRIEAAENELADGPAGDLYRAGHDLLEQVRLQTE